jgi:phytoene/squalene synthetase
MLRFGVDEGQIEGRVFTPEFRAMVQNLVVRTREMLLEGGVISKHVERELAVTLDLFRKGGEAILNGIVAEDFDVLRGRPVVSKARKLGLLMEALVGKVRAGIAA